MSYIDENILRNQKLDEHYNPFTGEGSRQERQLFELSDLTEKLYLPVRMLNVPWIQELGELGSLSEYINVNRRNNPLLDNDSAFETLNTVFLNERLDYDYEHWAALCAKIKPKRGGDFVPFILNYPQRLLHNQVSEMMDNEKPIFGILVKSRQFGGSTYIDNLMSYIQIRHKTNWNSLIAAHINQAAINIRSMVSNLCQRYPKEIDEITLRPFEGAQNIKIIQERSNKITIGSMETPDSVRSDDLKLAHLTEVASWKKTDGKSPEDLCQSILGTIPMGEPFTMYMLESTAKGVGNYFHRTWQKAVKGENGLKAIFLAWHNDQKNRIAFTENENVADFIKGFSNYDHFLWQKGATLEGIKFYHKQLSLFNGDKWRMQSEFPTTADEAFQSTGNRFFPQHYVLSLRKDNKEPIFKGDVFGDSTLGEKALDNIRFEPNERGNLWIWEMPDSSNRWDNRYVVPMDIGGTTEAADKSWIRVFDRLPMATGGDPKVVATWKGNIDQDLLTFKALQICKIYGNALFVPEDNSFDREKSEDGEHFQTILHKSVDMYRNIYIRNDEEKVGSDWIPKYGFNTNKKTKGLLLDALRSAARERMNKDIDKQDGYCYIEPDERVCSEMDCFEIKQNGALGATDGEHDDAVLSTGIGVYICLDTNKLPVPRMIEEQTYRRSTPRRESTF